MIGFCDFVARQDARHRIAIAMFLAAIAFFAVHGSFRFSTVTIVTWDVFAGTVLIFAWLTIITTPPEKLRARAKQQDVSRTVIFIFVVIAACVGLFAVVFLLRTNRGQDLVANLPARLILTLLAVVFAWLLVHTVFGLRYAHIYYGDRDEAGTQHAGGLVFPGENSPNYMDFAYFSFVIGMTSQVSDVTITSREMRRLVLLHGILSFGFNTVILALTISTASGLL
jgi:uncharacterized membrane protein